MNLSLHVTMDYHHLVKNIFQCGQRQLTLHLHVPSIMKNRKKWTNTQKKMLKVRIDWVCSWTAVQWRPPWCQTRSTQIRPELRRTKQKIDNDIYRTQFANVNKMSTNPIKLQLGENSIVSTWYKTSIQGSKHL